MLKDPAAEAKATSHFNIGYSHFTKHKVQEQARAEREADRRDQQNRQQLTHFQDTQKWLYDNTLKHLLAEDYEQQQALRRERTQAQRTQQLQEDFNILHAHKKKLEAGQQRRFLQKQWLSQQQQEALALKRREDSLRQQVQREVLQQERFDVDARRRRDQLHEEHLANVRRQEYAQQRQDALKFSRSCSPPGPSQSEINKWVNKHCAEHQRALAAKATQEQRLREQNQLYWQRTLDRQVQEQERRRAAERFERAVEADHMARQTHFGQNIERMNALQRMHNRFAYGNQLAEQVSVERERRSHLSFYDRHRLNDTGELLSPFEKVTRISPVFF